MSSQLHHEHNKKTLNLVIFGLKEEVEEDTLATIETELHNRQQIDTIGFIEATRLGKLIENKERLKYKFTLSLQNINMTY